MKATFLGVILVFLFIPLVVGAQAGGLVPCGGERSDPCTTEHVSTFANGLINFLITMLGVIAVIVLVFVGFKMVMSRGNEAEWGKAKEMFGNVIIGIIIILAAWLIIDTLLKGLTNRGLDYWGVLGASTPTTPSQNNSANNTGNQNSNNAGCPSCVPVQNIPCKNSQSCTVSPEYAERLAGLSSSGIEITEAWPPTRTHQAACHSNGTCTDVVFADRNFTPARVQAFQEKAAQNGFRAVYEPPNGVSCAGYTNCLPYSTTRSTGHHFSLYMQ